MDQRKGKEERVSAKRACPQGEAGGSHQYLGNREALIECESLENYPNDPRGPSCVVLGYAEGRPIHIVCGRAKNDWLLIITVYIPKPPQWLDPRTRGGGEK
jgi:hypothetical protein